MKQKIFSLCVLSLTVLTAFAQTATFKGISVNRHGKVYLSQADSQSVRINPGPGEGNEKFHISNDLLFINADVGDEVHVSLPELNSVIIGGKAEVVGETPFKGDKIDLQIGGDGKISLDLSVDELQANIGGLGKIVLSGTARKSTFNISGSGKVEAMNLKTSVCYANISGLGKCSVDVVDELYTNISGSGSVMYKSKPPVLEENISGVGKTTGYQSDDGSDTTHISFGSKDVIIIDREDKNKKAEKEKAKPIWAGLELGLNSYLSRDGNFDIPEGFSDLELKQAKSVMVSFNFLEKSFELGKSNLWFVTGLGINWNNYRFDNNVNLLKTDPLATYRDTSTLLKYEKSKLVTTYLTMPLMFEFFTSRQQKKAFHIGAGAILGLRIGSHTKLKYEEDGKTHKPKVYDDFNLNPFRYGFRVAFGYGGFNMFVDYYASTLFKENKGPTLYPVAAGITLANF